MLKTYATRWEWMSSPVSISKVEWSLYDDDTQQLLNDAVANNKANVEFEANKIKFQISFDKMVQKNLSSNFERPVRMCARAIVDDDDDDDEDKSDDWFYWEWLNELNIWCAYVPSITIELELNYSKQSKEIASLSVNAKNTKFKLFKINVNLSSHNSTSSRNTKLITYSIDFNKMKQTNEKSGFSRDIKRVASNITNSGPSSNLRKRSTSSASIGSLESADAPMAKATNQSKSKRTKKTAATNKENDEEVKMEMVKEEQDDEADKTSKSFKRKSIKDEPEENDEDEAEQYQPKSSKSAAKKQKIKSEKVKEEEEEESTSDIPLDETFCELVGFEYKIYKEQDDIYDVMLNQTNLQNNNNKYYLIQLVECVKTKKYSVWMRWGRVGKKGQNSLENCQDNLNKAKQIFCKKFQDKTANSWDERHSFVKYGGKYDMVHKEYDFNEDKNGPSGIKEEPSDQADSATTKIPPSKLDKRIQELTELICNVSEMEALLKEMKYDSKKAPLGKLSKAQIKAGYASLKRIEELINNKDFGSRDLIEANNEFYTRIPHDFGMKKPPVINTLAHLREKMRLIEVLDDVEVAVKALNQKSEITNPVDRHYDQLDCKLEVVEKTDKMYGIIEDYLHKTHAPTHNNYKLKLLEVFKAEKQQTKFNDCGNRMLLWHGSRITNWAGILSAGLKIAPPEAPVTGYMFGKGCYFADSSSKSANYCYTSSKKNVGILSLFDVALGQCNELKNADYNADKLPAGKSSTKGVGKSEPDRNEWVKLEDGCVVPCGRIKTTVTGANAANYSLLYNEYIVYNTDQVKLKYLVKVEFVYDDDDEDDE